MSTTTMPKLTPEQIESFGEELDAIRRRAVADLGERDAAYIRKVIRAQRGLEVTGRALMFAGFFPPAWLGGVTALSLSKILDNMEIGHNVMHGQYDWMKDPDLTSKGFEWDTACPGDQWRHSHNYMHHTHTNIVGKDRDIGYGVLRMSEDQPLAPVLPGQPPLCGPAGDLLPVRRRPARPGDRAHQHGPGEPGREARHDSRDLEEGPPADAEGLRPVSGPDGSVGPAHAGRQRSREPDPQPVGVHDHLLRALPRRHAGVHRRGDRGGDPRPVVPPPAARLRQPDRREAVPRPRPATSASRSSTTSSPTSRPTATPRSRSRCARSASATASRTTAARCTSSSGACCGRSRGSPCRTAASAPPVRTLRAFRSLTRGARRRSPRSEIIRGDGPAGQTRDP